jgi:hypothetical protein
LRLYRPAIVAFFGFRRENGRCAIWDFCNSICQ